MKRRIETTTRFDVTYDHGPIVQLWLDDGTEVHLHLTPARTCRLLKYLASALGVVHRHDHPIGERDTYPPAVRDEEPAA